MTSKRLTIQTLLLRTSLIRRKMLLTFWKFCQMSKQGKLIHWLDSKNSSSQASMGGERKLTHQSGVLEKRLFLLHVKTGRQF
nr:MAG TPA: hypothetical protein [Caudoviricetes sp.]